MKTHSGGESSILLLNVIEILERFAVPYAVIGAFAASFHGVVRASVDVDALISVDPKDPKREKLLTAFKDSKLKVQIRKADISDPVQGVIHLEDDLGNRVDLLLGIKGIPDDVYQRTITASFMDRDIKIIGLEDFVAMKIYAGNPQDIKDVLGVMQVSKDRFDVPLAKQLARGYGKVELQKLERILKDLKI